MTEPSLLEIGHAQNLNANLRRRLAARHVYSQAKWIYFGGASLAVILALVSPLVLLFREDLGPLLGAIAGAWIFISRLVFEPWRQRLQLHGATAQEMFDCAVLGIDWNEAIARRLPEEQIRRASGDGRKVAEVRDWYPAEDDCPWPRSVLLCQRANVVWARRQHRTFSQVLRVVAVAWLLVGIGVALWDGASLSTYLVVIALPSLPALLDALDMSRGHIRAANARQLLEDTVDSGLAGQATSATDLREIQDQLFSLRSQAPLVPEWFYKLVRGSFESDMKYAAGLAVSDPDGQSATGSEE